MQSSMQSSMQSTQGLMRRLQGALVRRKPMASRYGRGIRTAEICVDHLSGNAPDETMRGERLRFAPLASKRERPPGTCARNFLRKFDASRGPALFLRTAFLPGPAAVSLRLCELSKGR